MPPSPTGLAWATVRRLAAPEIRNSISDIFLGGDDFTTTLKPEQRRHAYDNDYARLDVSIAVAEQVQVDAEYAASLAVDRLSTLLPCSESLSDESACAGEFVDNYGRRMYRRPLTSDERSNLLLVFSEARQRVDFDQAIGIVIEAMVQSPNFLFRTELSAQPAEKRAQLGAYEVASALSYSLLRSAPDEELLDFAETGTLLERAQITAQARRLLELPRAKAAIADFFGQWLETNQVASGVDKLDPSFTPQLATAMVEETQRLVTNTVWSANATLASLLTATTADVNEPLAALYGVSSGSPDWQQVQLDATQRAGLLTRAAFITAQTSPSAFNPIYPGLFVRKKMFCQLLPPPPGDIPAPSKDPNLSTREKFKAHSDSEACRTCHAAMDPIGFGFERFDHIGRYRTEEQLSDRTVPLTGEGELVDTDIDGTFVGPVELSQRLAQSAAVHDCFVAHLMSFMLGRNAAEPNTRLDVDQLAIDAAADTRDIRELIAQVVASDAFLLRDASRVPTP